jgi:methylase of polypeptide subunit release factors
LIISALKHSKAKGLAIDISKKALNVAKQNAKTHKLSKIIH